ncbi:DUF2199 domain-containing protein [Mucilaginibacter sp.]|jgi:hypothetical protein|uniref:DUF2199 domain-containing protein n=1 Tax=Mucilaginibacter sp. TaxID=1882438 RepID=UPI002BB19032|nr:DUF2199 domain-containing protein [Mucilaginibacter sp.]HTI60902.1 DUF2199 domain-containing protein [Mucilaginibacter sp.]
MPKPIKYICSCCGKEHEEWPALTYKSPQNYDQLSDGEKKKIAELSDDFCIIYYAGQTGRFIRCTLTQKVTDHCEDLQYGLWVSLSEKSFQDYSDNFDNENHKAGYFGWLSNALPDYTFDESIPMDVFAQPGNQRPDIAPHTDFDHPFVHDYYNGITKAEAERRIRDMMERTNGKD